MNVAVDGRYAAGEKGAFEHTKSEPFARVFFKKANPRSSHRRCLDASDDQLLSLAERAVASAVVLMTLTLRIETRRRVFFFSARISRRARRPPDGKEDPERRTRRTRRTRLHARRGMNNTLSLSDAAETLVGFGGTILLIPKY
jgi:hypothetical protein